MKPKKPPPNLPDRGDRCALRASPADTTGTLVKYDPDTQWSTVEWDEGVNGPKVVHRFELMRADAGWVVADA